MDNMKQTELSFDKKDVFSIFNTQEAKAYIGQEGFIADAFIDLQRAIEKDRIEILESVNDDAIYCFGYGEDGDVGCLFLPANKILKAEKKWRPFTLEEFNEFFKIGDVIDIRARKSDWVCKWMYQGYSHNRVGKPDEILCLGSVHYSLQMLFDEYDYQDKNGNWHRFGVEA